MEDSKQSTSEEEMSELVRRFSQALEGDTCPHCQSEISERKQIGRSVYAAPCGCRLYQGRLWVAGKEKSE
jgi:hypothetical protein